MLDVTITPSPKIDVVALTKRALFLAWQACGGPVGMGRFRDRPDATEFDVWQQCCNAGDYDGVGLMRLKPTKDGGALVRADYVFGRMLKLDLELTATTITVKYLPDNGRFDVEYSAFAAQYPTPKALFDAADTLAGAATAASN